jgi:hypothetical protein
MRILDRLPFADRPHVTIRGEPVDVHRNGITDPRTLSGADVLPGFVVDLKMILFD